MTGHSPETSVPAAAPAPGRTRGDRIRHGLSARLRNGLERSRGGSLNVARAALAASLAYAASHLVWGHEFPFFSSIAAFVIIGFTSDAKMRKLWEMGGGVMLGVLLGEAARSFIGSGTWQIFVVVLVAGLASRLLDPGILFGVQSAIQSLLVVVMPVTPGMTPQGRILDALTGVVVAFLVHLLLAGDPRRMQRRAADRFYTELDATLTALALASRTGSREVADAALRTVRANSQRHTDYWRLANQAADEVAHFSPHGLRRGRDVERLQHLLIGSDRAMRNVRIIARRTAGFIAAVQGAPHSALADAFVAGQEAVVALRDGIAEDVDFTEARRRLRLFASYLTPEQVLRSDAGEHPGRSAHFQGVALVMQLRSLAIDLLEATGLDNDDAQRFLPSLLIAADGDTIGPRPLTGELSRVEPPATTEALELLITDRTDPGR
ncbi:FUSC family protein [Brachybacterium sp. EF45031]|uniref:FUSC family protein n=1 Tax=Brachybacterium sillae TaxID=2810536 RepID=UPI00217DEE35|nr:FUSC family protein [Brachybacterium sillae]MCS6712159.1 FUSC family protein [Brachybacterium sillae]